jgi:hypothetical protein
MLGPSVVHRENRLRCFHANGREIISQTVQWQEMERQKWTATAINASLACRLWGDGCLGATQAICP